MKVLQKLAIVLALLSAPIVSWSAVQEFDKIALFGFFLLPFIIRIDPQQTGSYRYVILSIAFSFLYLWLGQSYWALACGLSMVFAVIELRLGKLNVMAFFALLFYLPITRSFFTLFGFYIRLEITEWAAKLISLFYSAASFEETQLFHAGGQFSVDAGCMGLRLVITGFLLTLLLLNQTSLSYGIKLKSSVVSLFLSISFMLIVLANFFRIVFLILLQSAEGSLSHELIGAVALVLFHLLPMYFMARFVLKKTWVIYEPVHINQRRITPAISLGMIAVSILMMSQVIKASSNKPTGEVAYTFPGYMAHRSIDGVVTYSQGRALFTIKPMHPLSFANHHPMICWRGDGFEISNEVRTQIGETLCMRASLKSKSQNHLNTVWWYTNNRDHNTISELEWRYRAIFKQEDYYILNFTSDNEDELIYMINSITQEIKGQNLKL